MEAQVLLIKRNDEYSPDLVFTSRDPDGDVGIKIINPGKQMNTSAYIHASRIPELIEFLQSQIVIYKS